MPFYGEGPSGANAPLACLLL